MIFPVKIFRPDGTHKATVTTKELLAKSDAEFKKMGKKTSIRIGGIETPCEFCGTIFTPKIDRGMYCSPVCSQKAYKKRKETP